MLGCIGGSGCICTCRRWGWNGGSVSDLLAHHFIEMAKNSPNSIFLSEGELLEIVTGRSRGFRALRPSRGACCSEIDLLSFNGGRETCDEKCCGPHDGDLYDSGLAIAGRFRLK